MTYHVQPHTLTKIAHIEALMARIRILVSRSKRICRSRKIDTGAEPGSGSGV